MCALRNSEAILTGLLPYGSVSTRGDPYAVPRRGCIRNGAAARVNHWQERCFDRPRTRTFF